MRQELLLVIPNDTSVGTRDPKVNGFPGDQSSYTPPSLS